MGFSSGGEVIVHKGHLPPDVEDCVLHLWLDLTSGLVKKCVSDDPLTWASIEGGGGGGTPGDSVVEETSYGLAASAGDATTYSRSNHTHGSPVLGDSAPLALGIAVPGIAATPARSDHVHPLTGLVLATDPRLHDRQHSITSASDHSFPGGTTFLRADGVFATPAGGSDFLAKVRTSGDITNATTTLANLTGLVFTFAANSFYVIEFFAFGTSAAATTGHSFALDTSVAVTGVGVTFFHALANTGTLSGGQSIADATRTGLSSGVPTASALTPIYGSGLLQSGVLGGTAQLQWAPEVAASATIKAGAVMRVMQVS